MSMRKIASIVVGVSFVGGAIAAWMFTTTEDKSSGFGAILTLLGLGGFWLACQGVSPPYDEDENDG